jgi:putative multiple sugar transport system substrate-binding protein
MEENDMRNITAMALAVLLMFTLVGCQQTPAPPVTTVTPDITTSNTPITSSVPDIGVAMPTKSLPLWEHDGADIKNQLEAKGYIVDLMYADNNQTTQNSQIEELIAKGCKVMIIASIDGAALDSVLAEAKAADVTVIAYNRLLTNTENVDYYVAFDFFRYGALQGEYIEEALGLKDGKGPFNIELFTGAPDDGNVMAYYKSAMGVLKPYIDNGQLVVKSGQIDIVDVAINGWKSEEAKTRMDGLLTEYYTRDKLDAVLSPNDSIALGIITSLEDAGYTEFPIITGMDCDKPNVIAIKIGKQSMSVFPDTRILAAEVIQIVDAVMTDREIQHNGTEFQSNGITFSMSDNGIKQVPSFFCDPYVVTVNNIQEILIDGGTYTEADLDI